jgi:predicted MFS family arabinose efflux permease
VLDAARAGRPTPVRLRVYRDIFRNPLLGGLYGATACIITAHFAAFTYIEPLLINLQGVPTTALSGLLLLSGVSGLLGNVIAGKLIDRHLKGLIFAALLLSGARWRSLAPPVLRHCHSVLAGYC